MKITIKFPKKGQYFGVYRNPTDGAKYNIYGHSVYLCTASDQYRVVCVDINPMFTDSNSSDIFYRDDCVFQPVSRAVVAAMLAAQKVKIDRQSARECNQNTKALVQMPGWEGRLT